MMQIYTILMVAIVLIGGGGVHLNHDDFGLRGWPSFALAWGPVLLLAGAMWLIFRRCERRMAAGNAGSIIVADRTIVLSHWIALVSHAASVFAFGWLATVRGALGGDAILIDELVTILPPLVSLCAGWWLYYPIARRLRDATLVRKLDAGAPVHPMPPRRRYVILQLRMHVLLLLVPILAIVSFREAVEIVLPPAPVEEQPGWSEAITFLGVVGIFILAPLFARVLLDVKPLPAGEVRSDLLQVCRDHRVRVREVLLWRTDGTMINGAVMGLIGRIRYVLLTDALLESMHRNQVLAVMAHEIGHIRRVHMPWLAVALIAWVMIPGTLISLGRYELAHLRPEWFGPDETWPSIIEIGVTLAVAMLIFGWVSRRFERQADVFAAQHLSGMRSGGERRDQGDTLTQHAVDSMASALEVVARLNAINPRRKSWRHGSIRWRQAYLAGVVGQPIRSLGIDRQVRWIKLVSAALLILVTAISILLGGSVTSPPPAPPDDRSSMHDPPPTLGESEGAAGAIHQDARDRERLRLSRRGG